MKSMKFAAALTAILLGLASIPAYAANVLAIDEISYRGKGVISVELEDDVNWSKDAKATVKDSDGKSYPATLSRKDDDDCRLTVKGLKEDAEYHVTITGVRLRGSKKAFASVSGLFKTTVGLEAHQGKNGVHYRQDD